MTDFVHDGRHDERVEVWSAPCAIGADVVVGSDAWRKECRILAVSTQVSFFILARFFYFESRGRRGALIVRFDNTS